MDEAGRGSLFGPVFSAAVILAEGRPVYGLADSKVLPPARREELAERIRERAAAWAVAVADSFEIDRLNIYHASRLAMERAIAQLVPQPDYVLTDAMKLRLPIPHLALIKGDARCRSIAAASILAKVHRDACMREWDEVFPQYGLARNKGYLTPEHADALQLHGPTRLHRFSFEPVRAVGSLTGVWPAQPAQLALFGEELCRTR